jgi:hypothetical protein
MIDRVAMPLDQDSVRTIERLRSSLEAGAWISSKARQLVLTDAGETVSIDLPISLQASSKLAF